MLDFNTKKKDKNLWKSVKKYGKVAKNPRLQKIAKIKSYWFSFFCLEN